MWRGRCYECIPDEVPAKIAKVNKAPSYKSIAIAILKNDHLLKSLGFSGSDSDLSELLKRRARPQIDMFDGE